MWRETMDKAIINHNGIVRFKPKYGKVIVKSRDDEVTILKNIKSISFEPAVLTEK